MFQPLWILAIALIFACVPAAQTPAEPQKNETPKTFRSICIARNAWESSFNPYEVLDSWKKLRVDYHEDGTLELVVGNPKIDWSGIDNMTRKAILNMSVPEGETIPAISFRLKMMGSRAILMGYVYIDKYGIIYLYFWDEEAESFIRIPHHKYQNII